jgi:hypothetical protein
MEAFRNWLDQIVQRFCAWLNDHFPGGHGLAVVGNGLAGLGGPAALPVDRRQGPQVVHMSEAARVDSSGQYILGEGHSHPEDDCGFYAYCHMLGYPCVWCGGRNNMGPPDTYGDTSNRCPSGTTIGSAWFGCCWFGIPSQPRVFGFYDCCKPSASSLGRCGNRPHCPNWPGAKNWCAGHGRYHCTVAIALDQTC